MLHVMSHTWFPCWLLITVEVPFWSRTLHVLLKYSWWNIRIRTGVCEDFTDSSLQSDLRICTHVLFPRLCPHIILFNSLITVFGGCCTVIVVCSFRGSVILKENGVFCNYFARFEIFSTVLPSDLTTRWFQFIFQICCFSLHVCMLICYLMLWNYKPCWHRHCQIIELELWKHTLWGIAKV